MSVFYFISSLDLSLDTAGKKRMMSIAKSIDNKMSSVVFFTLINGKFSLNEIHDIQQHHFKYNTKIKHIWKFFLQLRKELKENKSQKILYLYPTSNLFFELLFFLFIKLSLNEKVIVDINEVRRYSFKIDKEMKLKEILIILFKYCFSCIVDLCFHLADGHIYISNSISSFYKKKHSIIIPILCHILPEKQFSLPIYNDNEYFNIGFAGTIDIKKEKLKVFLKTMSNLVVTGKIIHLNFYGFIPQKKYFSSELRKYQLLDYVTYHGMVKQNELIKKLKNDNHALILPRGKTKQNIYGFSTKLTDYLETQLPIITSDVGDIPLYFINNENAIVYRVDNPEDMFQKIEVLLNDYNKLAPRLVEGGNNLVVNKLHYTRFSDKINSFLNTFQSHS